MSRCFPFPSSDLSRKDAPPVGSIKKLHNESGYVKLRKENNRGKKENNKRSRQQDKLDYAVHKKKKLRHDQGSEFFESFRDWKKDSSDQCERSCVTEEKGLPSTVPNPCNSLESTQNSGKKNKLLVADDTKKKDQGLVLRIKLPLMMHKEPATANTSTVPCSSHKTVAVNHIIRPSSAGKASYSKEKTLAKQQELHSTPANEDPCFSGRNTGGDLMIEGVDAADFLSSSREGIGKCLNELILNWNPSSSQSYDPNPGSEDWLFAPPPRQSPQGAMSCKASKPDHKVGLVSANSLQPQACYLPDFDIYQLPYVVPF